MTPQRSHSGDCGTPAHRSAPALSNGTTDQRRSAPICADRRRLGQTTPQNNSPEHITVTRQPPSVTRQLPSVTRQPPLVTRQPPSVTHQPPPFTRGTNRNPCPSGDNKTKTIWTLMDGPAPPPPLQHSPYPQRPGHQTAGRPNTTRHCLVTGGGAAHTCRKPTTPFNGVRIS